MKSLSVVICFVTLTISAQAGAQSDVGYATVADARKAVSALPGAKKSEQQGWLIVEQMPVLWSFAPVGHEAYPSAVKRTMVQRDGRIDLDMAVLCEAPKPACDRLAAEFKSLNDLMKRNLGSR